MKTSKLVTSIDDEKRQDIVEKAAGYPAVITPENMVAMKLDLRKPWEKRNCMPRENIVNPLTRPFLLETLVANPFGH